MNITTLRPALRRLAALLALTGLGLGLGAGVAAAHVTVNPGTATAGGYTKLTFRVPNESATAKTDKITVTFPADTPFASVSVKKVPGWTATPVRTKLPKPVPGGHNTTITEAVTSITWQADASGAVGAGEFAEFDVSVGPVPEVASIAFPTVQHYSDGTQVRWDQPTTPGGAEPEKPAPTLTITPASGDGHGADHSVTTAPSVSAGPDTAGGSRPDDAARLLAVVGIVVGALGLLVGAVGLRRGRSR